MKRGVTAVGGFLIAAFLGCSPAETPSAAGPPAGDPGGGTAVPTPAGGTPDAAAAPDASPDGASDGGDAAVGPTGGVLDPTFGTGGMVAVSQQADDFVIDPDGK